MSGPGLGLGPGWGPADCEMGFLRAVLPARVVGRGAVGMPARLVPGPVDGPLGPMRWVSPEPGDWGSRRGCGRGGARCRGAGRWWCRSVWRYVGGPLPGTCVGPSVGRIRVPASVEEHVHPGAARSPTREGMHDAPPPGVPPREDILASIFRETALTASQGLQTDEQLHDDESFAAFMASCRDGAPATGPATTSEPNHTAHNREPTSPTRDNVSASHQAHLCRNYAALGPVAAVHATTAGDAHAGGQPSEVAGQSPHAHDAPTHEVSTPAAAGTVSEPTERMPPRVTQPWGQGSLDYAQSKGDAQRPSAEADCSAALGLDLWLPRTSNVEQLTIQVRTRWVLMDIHHIMNNSSTMAEVIFNHREGQHSPPPTVEHQASGCM